MLSKRALTGLGDGDKVAVWDYTTKTYQITKVTGITPDYIDVESHPYVIFKRDSGVALNSNSVGLCPIAEAKRLSAS